MPKKNKKNKKRTKPNVFVQSKTNDVSSKEIKNDNNLESVVEKQTQKVSVESSSSNYFSSEIKKMGIITTSMIVILAVLTIVLG
ncbi:MAG: hypothetical protein VX523_06225 [Chloroflexota bacterium]|nr:hypothetical protein [Chloroflexota bacterium]